MVILPYKDTLRVREVLDMVDTPKRLVIRHRLVNDLSNELTNSSFSVDFFLNWYDLLRNGFHVYLLEVQISSEFDYAHAEARHLLRTPLVLSTNLLKSKLLKYFDHCFAIFFSFVFN